MPDLRVVARFMPFLLLLACTMAKETSAPSPLATAVVTARGETAAVQTRNADAADDPAIWQNINDPAASLIVGTDKKAGLYVYGLDGKVRDFNNAGRVNNVDLAEFASQIVVAASDRNDPANGKVALFKLDPASARLAPMGTVAAGPGEAYGLCLYSHGNALDAFVVMKNGTIRQLSLDLESSAPRATIVRTLKLGTQSEGCVVDPRTHRVYVAEEDVGLWRFDAHSDGPVTPIRIAAADGQQIVADAEGVAIAAEGQSGGYLIVSSQGDSAYAVYDLASETYVGRFRVGAGAAIGGTNETDGIALATGNFGPLFPAGLMVIQDGINLPKAQNFKLVSWADIKAALGLLQVKP